MNSAQKKYGIEGRLAPELQVPRWLDKDGQESDLIHLKDLDGKFKVIYCFQAWCPACHTHGLPSLQKMTEALVANEKVAFLAIQTVFEGSHANTFDQVKEIQQKYNLHLPFGHDAGDESTNNISSTMVNYRTGGTPWFIFINQEGVVVFNDFHINVDNAIEFLKTVQ